jgi:hypothetical protein
MKITVSTILTTTLLAGAVSAIAQDGKPGVPPVLAREKEIALAKSAAPPEVSDNATIYALEAQGYVKVQEGTNGFTCLVSREVPESQEPECYDAEGSATLVPRVLRIAELRSQGKSKSEIDAEIAEGFRNGTFRAPRRPGIVYMLSRENRVVVDQRTGRVAPYVPHLMFYAPYLRNKDIGVKMGPGVKVFIINEGTPHALMIVPVPMSKEEGHH